MPVPSGKSKSVKQDCAWASLWPGRSPSFWRGPHSPAPQGRPVRGSLFVGRSGRAALPCRGEGVPLGWELPQRKRPARRPAREGPRFLKKGRGSFFYRTLRAGSAPRRGEGVPLGWELSQRKRPARRPAGRGPFHKKGGRDSLFVGRSGRAAPPPRGRCSPGLGTAPTKKAGPKAGLESPFSLTGCGWR